MFLVHERKRRNSEFVVEVINYKIARTHNIERCAVVDAVHSMYLKHMNGMTFGES